MGTRANRRLFQQLFLILFIFIQGSHKSWPRPHHAGQVWKRSFISTVRLTVHTQNPSRKRRLWGLYWTENTLKTKLFENGGVTTNMGFLPELSWNTNPKWPVIVAFSNFYGVVCTESVWCDFRVKTSLRLIEKLELKARAKLYHVRFELHIGLRAQRL